MTQRIVISIEVPDGVSVQVQQTAAPAQAYAPAPANGGAPNICPIHHTEWKGEPGDLWHKDPNGAYCRHPNNIPRPRGQR